MTTNTQQFINDIITNANNVGGIPIEVSNLNLLIATLQELIYASDRFGPYKPPFLGQVGDRCRISGGGHNATNKMSNAQTYHTIYDDIDQTNGLKIVLANWYVVAGTDTANGGTANFRASLSIDNGFSWVRFPFGKGPTGVVLDGGTIESDPLLPPTKIRSNTRVLVRVFMDASAGGGGIMYTNAAHDIVNGDSMQFAPSLSDLTLGGNIPNGGAPQTFPVGLVSITNVPSLGIYGDSKDQGAQGAGGMDSVTYGPPPVSGYTGEMERLIGGLMPYINCAMSSESLQQFATGTNCSKRQALAKYLSGAVFGYLANDLATRTSAQMAADWLTVCNLFPQGMPKFIKTVSPFGVTSTDNFASLGNQTVGANNTLEQSENVLRKAGYPGFAACIDVASILSDQTTPGKWPVTGIRTGTDGNMAVGSVFTAASGNFTTADIGKKLTIPAALTGPATLNTVIASINSPTSVNTTEAGTLLAASVTWVLGAYAGDGSHASYTADIALAAARIAVLPNVVTVR